MTIQAIFIVVEFLIGLFLWWFAIYLITQNPFSRIMQLAFGAVAVIGLYFTSDILFYLARSSGQFYLDATLMRSLIWIVYLPIAFLCHASFLQLEEPKELRWRRFGIFILYIFTFAIIFLEIATSLTRNYAVFFSPSYRGNLADATGKYFFLVGIFIISLLLISFVNFYKALKKQNKNSNEWYKFFLPCLGMGLAALLSPLVIMSYYSVIPHIILLPILDLSVIIIPVTFSIVKYGLFISDTKIIFGRKFLYSSISIVFLVIIYLAIISFAGVSLNTVSGVLLPFIIIHLIIVSHPIYNWLETLIGDFLYNSSLGYSIVNDSEVGCAIKNFQCPEKLETSTLFRLKIANKLSNDNDKVLTLRQVLHDSIEFLMQDEGTKRTKQNLKYHLLKMIAYDQAEEGQILWELGFEEYPLRIMNNERASRQPLFKVQAASDYSYISRNAYLALKREAIHDVAWRISYLEKNSNNN